MLGLDSEALAILVALGPGYLGFRIYTIDCDWTKIHAVNILYGSLAFSGLAYLALGLVSEFAPIVREKSFLAIAFLFVAAIAFAFAWRRWGHTAFHNVLQRVGVTNEDNEGTAWQKIFGDPGLYVTQLTLHLINGDAIQCDDTASFDKKELRDLGIYPYYADETSILMIPTQRKKAGDTTWEDVAVPSSSADWGQRLIICPA